MLSFLKFENKDNLGNQLFQYAFIRSTAIRLNVDYCFPDFIGDKIFMPMHDNRRVNHASKLRNTYTAPPSNPGFIEEALNMPDNTNIFGYFLSEKYFDPEQVKQWYQFNDKIKKIREKYSQIFFSECTSISLRIGDDYDELRFRFPLYCIGYYKKALSLVKHKKKILIFSDRIDRAKKYFSKIIDDSFIFIENNSSYEDLYLISLCHDNIITNSTFAWWGAWLNQHKNKIVIAPKEWFRPGGDRKTVDIVCEDWKTIRALNPVLDHYLTWMFKFRLKRKTNHLINKYFKR